MQYRKIGNTDLQVSAVTMGCWAIVGDQIWGEQEESDAIAAIRSSFDAGVTTFDTAEVYGDGYSEEILAKALEGKRSEVVLCAKPKATRASVEEVKKSCEESLQRLKTDYIDLYQIHWPNRDVPFQETAEGLKQLKQEGKIREIGVCNFGVQDAMDYLKVGEIVSNQLAYNLLWRAIEFEVQPLCVENNISILCYSPIMQGLLTGKFSAPDDVPESRRRSRHFSSERPENRHQDPGCEEETFDAIRKIKSISESIGEPMGRVSLAWLLHQPAVATVLAGARNAEQARENARAGDLNLDADTVRQLTEATKEVKQLLGPNPDLWQSESRMK